MRRAFQPDDNGKRFHWMGRRGTLEFPLEDPGGANAGEGILWFDVPDSQGFLWNYVAPQDVDPEGWVAEGTPTERHTPAYREYVKNFPLDDPRD